MEFIQKAPSEDISFYVNKFMIVKSGDRNAGSFTSEVVPTGFHYLNFGEGSEFIYHHPDRSVHVEEGILLNGMLQNLKVLLEMKPPFCIINCELKPTAIFHLFNQNADEFTDRYIGLDKVIGKSKYNQLYKEIIDEDSDNNRIHLLESFLRERLPSSPPDHYVDRAVDLINRENGKRKIKSVADEVYIGIRQLEKKFKKMVGVTPSYYANLIQFVNVLQIYEINPDIPLQDLAYRGGYYDLPHMLKAFKRFAGTWPSRFRELEKRYVEEIL